MGEVDGAVRAGALVQHLEAVIVLAPEVAAGVQERCWAVEQTAAEVSWHCWAAVVLPTVARLEHWSAVEQFAAEVS